MAAAAKSKGLAGKLKPETHRMRTRVTTLPDEIVHTSSSDFPGSYPGIDDSWNLEKFKEEMRIDIVSLDSECIEFDLVGVDAAIANTLRRILIAEVPTMAVEHVYIICNTSIIQDEVLAHRLGLIPIVADPTCFKEPSNPTDFTDETVIVFDMDITCQINPDAPADTTNNDELYINSKVHSKHLEYRAEGWQQAKGWTEENVRPVMEDILIAKLRPGQKIQLEAHCIKGTGKVHAKWSPVGTASYRLLPEIELLKPVRGEQAERLVKSFSKGVMRINSDGFAEVVNARLDTMSRNVFQHEDLKDAVRLGRVRNHFIFSVESVGQMPPEVLVVHALRILREKCSTLHRAIDHASGVVGDDELAEGEDEEFNEDEVVEE